MTMNALRWASSAALMLSLLSLIGCAADELKADGEPAALEVGDKRTMTLRYLRFDVEGFSTTYTKEDLLALPQGIQDSLWLFDLDLSNGENSPRLLDSSLQQIKRLDPATLDPAARNMQQLLNMTPDNAVLDGTSFEEVALLSPVIGIDPAVILADLLEINIESEFLTTTAIAQTVVDNVIATHPNAQTRPGPITSENPDGIYDVAPGTLPITLADAAADFRTLGEKFGPVFRDGVYHPGFLEGDVRAQVFEDDFSMTITANANALPYKGIDLTNASTASVNSIASQIDNLFDFDDPNYLQIDGLVPGIATIEQMRFRIEEADGFVSGGTSPFPATYGDSRGWELPAYTIERILLDSARTAFRDLQSEVRYLLPDSDTPAVVANVDDGWTVVDTGGGLGSPPLPQYIWDVLLEVGQVRLHDPVEEGGERIPEGEANVSFELTDVPVGLTSEEIEARIRANIQEDPTALLNIASDLLDSTRGAADFYYFRPPNDAPEELQGDYLYFVSVEDLGLDDEGNPARAYNYRNPGFFADPDLTDKVSTTDNLAGDDTHEKVEIAPGDVLYIEDDVERVYQLTVGDKPSQGTIEIEIERVR